LLAIAEFPKKSPVFSFTDLIYLLVYTCCLLDYCPGRSGIYWIRCPGRSEKPSRLPVCQTRSGSPDAGGLVVDSQLVVAVSYLGFEIIIFILIAITKCIFDVAARSESEI
jgi:hypothetical protein